MSSDMNPGETPAEVISTQNGFTTGEMDLVVACFSTLVSKPEIDWDKLAVSLKMKDAKSAARRFNKFYAKHGPAAQQSAGSSPVTPGQTGKCSGRAGKGPGNDGGPVPDAATKVAKRAARKPKVKVEKEEEDKDED